MIRYRKPPITEAVIDFGVNLPSEIGVTQLQSLSSNLSSEFPDSKEIVETDFVFSVGAENKDSGSKTTKTGFRLQSADKRWVIQARLTRFTLSLLHSYEDWDSFRGRARSYWPYYRDVAQPKNISRVGVRYINRIDVPRSELIKDYLKDVPGIPNELTGGEDHFFLQLKKELPDISSTLVLNYATVGPTDPETKSIILDIDIHREGEWNPNDDNAWTFLDQLRDRKNKIFETCITDKFREQIK